MTKHPDAATVAVANAAPRSSAHAVRLSFGASVALSACAVPSAACVSSNEVSPQKFPEASVTVTVGVSPAAPPTASGPKYAREPPTDVTVVEPIAVPLLTVTVAPRSLSACAAA